MRVARWCLLGIVLLAGRLVAADGPAIYENYCAACHGPDGRGQTPQGRKVKAHNLRESRLVPAEIEARVREGARNKSGAAVMPAFGKELSDEEIRAVAAVVLAFRAPPDSAR